MEEVQPDDLDQAFLVMRGAILRLAERFPNVDFVADYTGGTKTMTAALVCAALDSDRVTLQLVSGARADLERVQDGSEHAMEASVARLRLDRAMAPYLGAWNRFAYREAAEGLERIRIAVNSPDRQRLGIALTLSRTLALWDDFDHRNALKTVGSYAGRVAESHPWMLPALHLLTHEEKPQCEPARYSVSGSWSRKPPTGL